MLFRLPSLATSSTFTPCEAIFLHECCRREVHMRVDLPTPIPPYSRSPHTLSAACPSSRLLSEVRSRYSSLCACISVSCAISLHFRDLILFCTVSEGSLLGKILTGTIVVVAVIHAALGISFSSFAYAHPSIVYWQTNLKWDSTAGLTCAAICDVIIAASMCYFLHSRRTGFSRSEGLINKLMLYSVESGALTSICAVAVVISFLVRSLLYFTALSRLI
jgi:hypothetical protein